MQYFLNVYLMREKLAKDLLSYIYLFLLRHIKKIMCELMIANKRIEYQR
jgi:hypothetical protein